MDPPELHSDYVRDRFDGILQECARQRELPPLRLRLARKLRAFAARLEPEAEAFQVGLEQARKRV